jgi:hypothetical protein
MDGHKQARTTHVYSTEREMQDQWTRHKVNTTCNGLPEQSVYYLRSVEAHVSVDLATGLGTAKS